MGCWVMRMEVEDRVLFEEGTDVGQDEETPVVENYGIPAPYKFTHKINKVTIDMKEMKTAEKMEEDELPTQAAYRKALSD